MKKYILSTILGLFITTSVVYGATILFPVGGGTGWGYPGGLKAHTVLIGNNLGQVATASPSTAGFVLTSNGVNADPTFQASSGGGSGNSFAFPFTVFTNYNATTTVIGFNGLFSTASTTFSGPLHLPLITTSFLGTDSLGNVYGFATSTIKGSQINNDSGWTSNTGTLTSITAGAGHVNNGTSFTTTGTLIGAIATSAIPVINPAGVAYWTGAGDTANPAKLGTTATTTLTGTAPIAFSQPISVIGGSASVITCATATAAIPGCISAASFSKHDSATTTFSTGLTYTLGTNAVTVNTSQNIATLSNLTTDGFVTTSGAAGTLGVQTFPITLAQGGTFATSYAIPRTLLYYDGTRFVSTSTNPLYVDAVVATSTTASSSFAGPSVTIGSSTMAMANSLLAITGSVDNYIQANLRNKSNGLNSSASYVATADNGTDSSYYSEFGINGSRYSQAAFNSQNAGDGFATASDGGMVIGTASTTNPFAELRFITGGTASSSIRAMFTQTGFMGIGTTTPKYAVQIASTTAVQLALTDGVNPAYTFRTTGASFYMSTASPLTNATNTLSIISVDPNGNVGIGKDIANRKLYVLGDVFATYTGSSHTAGFDYNNPTGAGSALNLTSNNANTSSLQISGAETGVATLKLTHTGAAGVNASLVNFSSNSATYLGQGIFMDMFSAADTQKLLNFRNNSVEKLTMLGGGQLGLSTTTPAWQLQISSSTASTTFKPQLALSDFNAAANLKHITLSYEGGSFDIATATDLYATSTVSTFYITKNGTTTVQSLNILGTGSGTTTSAVGFNISNGCYAVAGSCVGGGTAAAATYPINSVAATNGSGALIATGTQLTVGNLLATTSATNLFNGNINLVAGKQYQYAGVKIAIAQPTQQNWYIGNSGNLTGSGTYNMAMGDITLGAVTSGSNNMGMGGAALEFLNSGSDNIAVGFNAQDLVTGGGKNVSFGTNSLRTNDSGNGNIAFGYQAGYSLTGGANIIFGMNVEAPVAANSGQLNIGNLLYGTGLYNNTSVKSSAVVNGSIGIGTSTASGLARLVSATTSQPQLALQGNITDNPFTFRSIGNSFYFATASPLTLATTSLYTPLSINANGYLGIGTSTPWGQVSIDSTAGTGAPQFVIGNSVGLNYQISTSTQALFMLGTSSPFALNGTLVTSQTAGGRMVIATTSTAQISLVANTTDNIFNIRSIGGAFYLATSSSLSQATSTNSALIIDPNGQVYLPETIGASGAQTGAWCYNSSAQLIRESAVCTVSARKFKTDIQPLTVGLSDLLKLNPVSYFKKNPLDAEDSHIQMGFIADEVASSSPLLNEMLVTYVGGGTSGEVHAFRYDQFTALITKSIQELYNKFQSAVANLIAWNKDQDKSLKLLEDQNAKQQKQIDTLQAEINALKK